jgi:hypothetical protein
MKDLTTYKKTLKKVVKKLNHFDLDELDCNYKKLKIAFDIAYKFNIFDLSDIEKEKLDLYKYELFKHLTKISGGLSFLAIQILAANAIMKGNKFHLKEKYFKKKCGIAINHLRAPITLVWAKKVPNGYKLNGTLTWASGYKIFDTLLIGFHCDGLEYEVIAKFKKQDGFKIGNAEKTFVGHSLNTVDIELDDFFVENKHIVSSKPIGNYTKAKSVSKTVHLCLYALGNTALLYTQDVEFKKDARKKLNTLRDKFLDSADPLKMDILRVKLFELVHSIITTAIVLYGGKSILSKEALQRLYREIIMFNANGLNNNLKKISKSNFLK